MFQPRILGLALAGLFAFTSMQGHGQNPPKQKDPATLPSEAQVMQVKLKRAQTLLEALTREDYKALEENANSLVRISDASEFLTAYKTDDYRFEAAVFKKNAQVLAAKAHAKNIDGATLAYQDMTRNCVSCHNYFRGRKRD